jgi:hypothetical protein
VIAAVYILISKGVTFPKLPLVSLITTDKELLEYSIVFNTLVFLDLSSFSDFN